MDKNILNELIKLSNKALIKKEVPIGAIVVDKNNKIISKGYNLRESKNNVLYHAEIIAINKACKRLNNWRLNDCTLYTTLFPCPMCASVIKESRIKKVVYLIDTNNYEKNLITKNILNSNYSSIIEVEKFESINNNIISDFFKSIR